MKYEEKFFEMTTPHARLVEAMAIQNEDILILGAGGKIGPGLAVTAARAQTLAQTNKRVIVASLFTHKEDVIRLEKAGVETIEIDLANEKLPEELTRIPSVIYMVGRKFGTTGSEHETWFINTILPAFVLDQLGPCKFVSFSTGNVYAPTPIHSKGSNESDTPKPVGEYAQSCLARDRVVEHYSVQRDIRSLLFRLNYAIDYRYGVLYDIAMRVFEGKTILLDQGYFNCLWQADVYEYALRSLCFCDIPAKILNVTGPTIHSVRETALYFADRFQKEVHFGGEEGELALLSNASAMITAMGAPHTTFDTMLKRVGDWILKGGESLSAPTHFETVDGRY